MNHQSLLRVQDVSKTFRSGNLGSWLWPKPARKVRGLDRVSFEVPPGQVTALLGPNGAGKTTLINIICDLVRADGGHVSVAGLPVPQRGSEARRQIGLVTTNERSFFWRLTGRQNLVFFAAMQDFSRRQARQRARELLAQFGLEPHADRLFHTYSTGMRKRLTLARALMHDPAVLLMDEATNGLDAPATEELLAFIRDRVAASERAVLWATHRLEEVLTLCDRVIVLIAGRIRFHGPISEFTDWCTAQARTQIEVECSPAQRGPVEAFVRSIGATVGPAGTRTRSTLATGGGSDQLSGVVRGLLDLGANVRRVEPRKISLSEAFDHLARRAAGAADDRAADGHA